LGNSFIIPNCGWRSCGTRGGSSGFRRMNRRKRQIRKYPRGVDGVPPGPRAKKA
jgi:hypothetical protein